MSRTMDFFEHQAAARRRTGLLVAYYGLAVMLIIVAIYVAVSLLFGLAEAPHASGRTFLTWNPSLFAFVAIATSCVVLLGTVYKIVQLRTGGEIVARALGGRPVSPLTQDADERRLLNIVEEMAIASGTPVPKVFVLDEEPGINAFAAGYWPRDAVIAVTRGCLQRLTRDELQGVIGHEFSHILNGDMRLNLRLIGVLHGILLLALIGYGIVRSTGRSSVRIRGRRQRGGGAGAIVLLGVALMAIGYIGVFFARLIKSAVSRQREFLADASAVQFTRNPTGLAGALRKILTAAGGALVLTPRAEEASHLFFANALRGRWLQLWATHPPIEERLRRIEPSFLSASAPKAEPAGLAAWASAPSAAAAEPALPATPFTSQAVVRQVGRPSGVHLQYAAQLLESLPAPILTMTRDPTAAQALLYGLLLSGDRAVREPQILALQRAVPACVHAALDALLPQLDAVAPQARLPLAELCIEVLRDLSPGDKSRLWKAVESLIQADQQMDLFEYALARMIRKRLFGERELRLTGRRSGPLGRRQASLDLLACLAWWGADRNDSAQRAFEVALSRMGVRKAVGLRPAAECDLSRLDRSLDALQDAPFELRRSLIEACAGCVGFDQQVTGVEAELLRVIADALDCPVPPLLGESPQTPSSATRSTLPGSAAGPGEKAGM